VKYLIMIYTNTESRRAWQAYSDADKKAGLDIYAALNEDLAKSGELIVSESLADPSEGRRVLVRDGQLSTTDGPFAEVKEHLAGFYLIDCENMDRAVEWAGRVPETACNGYVEVRPILEYQM